jgi:hypothetical protein
MNARKMTAPPASSSSHFWFGLGAAALIAVAFAIYWLRPTPQFGPDEDVLRTVDALFTAITGRSEKAVYQCEQRLHAYQEAGKLPLPAADALDGIISQAKSGGWAAAAQRLYAFISDQRGDETREPDSRKKRIAEKWKAKR